ncbi:MAG: inosine-5-monophosphate dehydrogenase [Flammeovirgaceae bacterium]|nr:inosine-5-monophosphate dehydrogenase [Flammeovirgaceae bacterium]MBE62098.1 inosine-5-monophosphate dehydrogenase [Flammeovirgaceae bacterium]MBR07496.1 inosine-5-monophosphate dehydrogenase [Rickettsiales bacterium]HCX24621.1 inosine-5-monophosphate dehydrogenase [Cytophagales bacterium]|tara:strand:- start:1460 stop:1918 length:459 start_codon:yes stop_codon:yes gene_type:complete
MVKSYRGVPVAKPAATAQKVTVSDYMSTRLITFRPEQHMDDVINTLLKYKISGGPVVNADNELVGVISEGDCMKEVVRGKYNNMPNLNGMVAEHMTSNVISISPETNIFDAAKMFLDKRIRRFPVVNHGKLVGQISQKDIMRAVHNMQSHTW